MRKINYIRRIFTLLLAIALCTSLATVAFASTVTETDTYALARPNVGELVNQYESPYILGYSYGNDGYTADSPQLPYDAIRIFSLYEYNNPDAPVVPAYCTDKTIYAKPGVLYRRLNLEDSTFSGSSAGRIRAILKNGFYVDNAGDPSTHEQRVKNEVAQLAAKAGFTDQDKPLTLGEAISATQSAIWEVAHGSEFEPLNFCYRISNKNAILSTATRYYSLCRNELNEKYEWIEEYGILGLVAPHFKYISSFTDQGIPQYSDDKAYVHSRINRVYEYLLSLDPVPAAKTEQTVSPASFVELNNPVYTQNADGTFNVSITTSVYVNMASDDALTLTATLNGATKSTALSNGTNTKTLTFENVPADAYTSNVKFSISGYQTVAGYFLFDAVGERDSAQTMVGYSNSRMPVYAEVIAEDSRILNINKSTSDFTPISDIVFDVYYADNYDTYPGEDGAKNNPLQNTLAQYTLITDTNGQASLNLTQHGLSDGVYLLVERHNPKVVKPLPPFYVTIPGNVPGQDPYNVTIYAKNQLKDVPVVTPKGGIHLMKVDEITKAPLAGAEFTVYRATKNESEAGVSIPGLDIPVVQVSFYLDEAMTGDLVTEVTSGSDGSFGIYGLVYGDYYLVEKQAPDGYNLMDKPLTITIDENSLNSSNQNPVTVYNKKGTLLPDTGGMGTTLFTTSGGALIFVACLFLFINKRKVRKEA